LYLDITEKEIAFRVETATAAVVWASPMTARFEINAIFRRICY
jgi:hypothetical protein